jgi:SEC-C motif/Trypsin-like peptidase domain
MSIIDQLVHCTVRLLAESDSGSVSCGTGYFTEFCENAGNAIPCVVTNKHVVLGSSKVSFFITLAQGDAPDLGKYEEITVSARDNNWVAHPNPDVDLVALPVGHILNAAAAKGKPFYFRTISPKWIATPELLAELTTMEPVVMVGYPTGLWDKTHNLPIVRRGVTATHPRLRLNGKPEFLIDAACFRGSSGSPVFLAHIGSYSQRNGAFVLGDKVVLLGTLYAGPQFTAEGEIVVVNVQTNPKALALSSIPTNLGLVIQAAELVGLEDEIRKKCANVRQVSRNELCFCGSGKRYKNCCGMLSANTS